MKTKLKPADKKFMQSFFKFTERDFNAEPIRRANSFTGQSFEVDPICAKCIDFVFLMENLINTQNLNAIQLNYPSIKSIGGAIQKFDRARMIVLKMDSETYMGILD